LLPGRLDGIVQDLLPGCMVVSSPGVRAMIPCPLGGILLAVCDGRCSNRFHLQTAQKTVLEWSDDRLDCLKVGRRNGAGS
jgi:hypothetical protein